jgi:hypothetical protein
MYSKIHTLVDNFMVIYLNRPLSIFYGELNVENDIQITNYNIINKNLNLKFLF